MGWKFHSPPGWEVPAEDGWVPPPGWVPDPAWPPAPAGWPYWIPDGAPAAGIPWTQPPAPAARPWYLRWWTFAGAAVLVLCLCGGGLAAVTAVGGMSTPRARATTAAPTRGPISPPRTATAPPTPSRSPVPATSAPVPEDVRYSGTGSTVVKLALDAGTPHVAAITHQGSSNFTIWALDDQGKELNLVVNAIGEYSGVRPLDFDRRPAALRIGADGDWTLLVQALAKAPAWSGTAAGTGPAVLRVPPELARGLTIVKFTHAGKENFIVFSYGAAMRGNLLVNDIGAFSGETTLPDGTRAVAIQADGAWTFTKS